MSSNGLITLNKYCSAFWNSPRAIYSKYTCRYTWYRRFLCDLYIKLNQGIYQGIVITFYFSSTCLRIIDSTSSHSPFITIDFTERMRGMQFDWFWESMFASSCRTTAAVLNLVIIATTWMVYPFEERYCKIIRIMSLLIYRWLKPNSIYLWICFVEYIADICRNVLQWTTMWYILPNFFDSLLKLGNL